MGQRPAYSSFVGPAELRLHPEGAGTSLEGGLQPSRHFPLQAPQVGTFKASRKNRGRSFPQTPFFLGKVKGGQTPPDPLYIHICGYRGPATTSTSDAMQSAQVTPTPHLQLGRKES